jgi:hypothetical protein
MANTLLGLSEEDRLAFEQVTGVKTEQAQIIVEQSVTEAQRLMNLAIREVQEVVGPHGAISRLQSGGIRITPGTGVGAFQDGVLKTTIDPDGNLLAGSNIEDPAFTSFVVFVNNQVYNNEEMGEGDLLIGNNSADTANVKYDASEGQLQFRFGTTVKVYMDTDGSISFGTGTGILNDEGITIIATGLLAVNNGYKFVDEADTTQKLGGLYAIARHSPNFDAYVELRANPQDGTLATVYASVDAVASDTAIARLTADSGLNGGGAATFNVRQNATGSAFTENINTMDLQAAVTINDAGADLDFRVESDTNVDAIVLDASLETVGLMGVAIVDGGTEKRFEIGTDHYIPTRTSSNPNVYFNEANQDMDFHVDGDVLDDVFMVDAGLDMAKMGGSYARTGKINIVLTAGNTYNDWTPTGLSGASVIWLGSSGSSLITITGMSGGVEGRIINLIRTGGSVVRFKHLNGGSSAANQFHFVNGVDYDLESTNDSIELIYENDVWMLRGLSAFKSNTTPANLGTAAAGTSPSLSRADHVHGGSSGTPATGWVEVTDSWSYASASTITVPSDATTVYGKWTKIRFKQGGGYKYYTIASLTATVITVIVNTDYTVANSAITNIAYSNVESPLDFPDEFNYSPTLVNITKGNGTIAAAYRVVKGCIKGHFEFVLGTTSSTGSSMTISPPVQESAAYADSPAVGIIRATDTSASTTYQGTTVLVISTHLFVIRAISIPTTYAVQNQMSATVPFTWASTDILSFQFDYFG